MLTNHKVKKTYFLLLLLLIFSCTNDKKHKENTSIERDTIVEKDTIRKEKTGETKADPKQKLVGEWKEHWGIGMETNVAQTELYKIELGTNGDIIVNSQNKKKYKIDQLLFDGKELTFRKQNKFYPKGKFYVYYKLKLHDDYNWMEGPITNNKNQKDYVKWERVGGL